MKNKNIFVIITSEPSRLLFDVILKELHLQNKVVNTCCFPLEKRNIYITNNEEIKEGDWCLKNTTIAKAGHTETAKTYLSNNWNKIILATDQDLIKDGVQAIDDVFLEWFCENLNCEFVETELYHGIKSSVAEISAVSGNGLY